MLVFFSNDALQCSSMYWFQDEDLNGVHVIVNYGNRDGDHNFSVPMARENIPKIRASLSGFYVFEIFLVSSPFR